MSRPSAPDDDGWSTPSYAGSKLSVDGRSTTERPAERRDQPQRRVGRAFDGPPPPPASARQTGRRGDAPPTGTRVLGAQRQTTAPDTDGWSAAGPTSARDQRATRSAERRAAQESARTERSMQRLHEQTAPKPYERGMRWWAALLVLIAITVAGAIIDSIVSTDGQDSFNIAIVVGSVAGILLVKRSHMFPIVIAPPIVYSITALVQLYLRSQLSSDRRGAISTIIDAVQNYLVYGFPALAIATAAVLIIAGIRLVSRK